MYHSMILLALSIGVILSVTAKPSVLQQTSIAEVDKQMMDTGMKNTSKPMEPGAVTKNTSALVDPGSGETVVIWSIEDDATVSDDEENDPIETPDEDVKHDTMQDVEYVKDNKQEVAVKEENPTKESNKAENDEYNDSALKEFETEDDTNTNVKRSTMNGYRSNFAWACPNGRALTKFSSVYSSAYRDRKWSGECTKYLPSGYVGSRFWTVQLSYDNEYNGNMRSLCPPQAVMTGLAGAHYLSSKQDRKYKIYCTHMWHHKQVGCKWTGYINNFREHAFIDLACKNGYYMTGLYSYQRNGDRRWNVRLCKLQRI